jgi:hypothetical protein
MIPECTNLWESLVRYIEESAVDSICSSLFAVSLSDPLAGSICLPIVAVSIYKSLFGSICIYIGGSTVSLIAISLSENP